MLKIVRSALCGVLLAVAGVAMPAASGSVNAACHGSGNYFSSNSGWGYEASQSGTCDNLTDYNGLFQDWAYDGYQVRIKTRWINGSSAWVNSGLTNAYMVSYYYGYWDSNKSTNYKICRRRISDGYESCAAQGSNYGF